MSDKKYGKKKTTTTMNMVIHFAAFGKHAHHENSVEKVVLLFIVVFPNKFWTCSWKMAIKL